MRSTLFGAVSAVALLGTASAASAGVINFEGDPYENAFDLIENSTNTNQDLPITGSTVTFRVTGEGLGDDTAIVYDTNNSRNRDDDLEAPFTDIDTGLEVNPGNIAVIGRERGTGRVDDTNNRGSMIFTLSEAVDFVSFRVFDVGDNAGNLTVEYFDENNNSLGSQNVGGDTSDNQTQLITFSRSNAEIVSFEFGGSGGIDDIYFTPTSTTPDPDPDPDPGPTPAPVPATMALLGGGLVALGILARRRKAA